MAQPQTKSATKSRPAQATRTIHSAGNSITLDPPAIAALAYELWQARGCPDGSPDIDWFHAEQQLQSRLAGPALRSPKRLVRAR